MDRGHHRNGKDSAAKGKIAGSVGGIMNVYDVNLLFSNDADQLVHSDREPNEKEYQTDEWMTFSKGHLQPELKGSTSRFRGLDLGKCTLARV
jgi:hypothetical protein